MSEGEIRPVIDDKDKVDIKTIKPLSDFQLAKEKTNNDYALTQLYGQYEALYDQFEQNQTEDLAIELINLRAEIDIIAANYNELSDAQIGIRNSQKNETIN